MSGGDRIVKSIIVSPESVRATLDGRKTMARRVAKGWYFKPCGGVVKAPYRPGDLLYVRETWCHFPETAPDGMGENIYYKADQKNADEVERVIKYNGIKWRSPATMPRAAARLFLRVKAVRVERLQEITEADAIAEGIIRWTEAGPLHAHYLNAKLGAWLNFPTAREAYASWWDEMNARRGYPWDSNPCVFVYKFEREEAGADG